MRARDITRQIATLLGIIGGVAINSIPATGGGFDSDTGVGAISDQTFTLITPADYTFSIWGIIFIWTIVFAVHQALPSQRENPLYRRIGWWAALNGVLTGLWTLLFISRQFTLAWLLILVIFGTLLTLSVRAGLGRATPGGRDYWLAYVPFNINFGWVTVATIVNTAQVLRHVAGWEGAPLSAPVWAMILVVVAAAVGLWQVLRLGNTPFGAVLVWALAGIAVGQSTVALVLFPAVVATVLVAAALVVEIIRQRRHPLSDLASGARGSYSAPK